MKFSEISKAEIRLDDGTAFAFDKISQSEVMDKYGNSFTKTVFENQQTGEKWSTGSMVIANQVKDLGASPETEITFDELVEATCRKEKNYYKLE